MKKIMIVDDASFMRNSLGFIVESAGYDVVGMAKDGEEAIKMYRKLKPDIVTLDILMEGVGGVTVLEEIMREDPGAKVIMITAVGLDNIQKKTHELGASGYIRKPFKKDDVIDEIKKVSE